MGRVVQGAAGGLLAGLGYAVINSALPQSLWTKASALVSAMWGVGTLLGPAAGGLFAQFGSWRWAFGVLVALAAAIAVLVPVRATCPRRATAAAVRDRIPVWSLLLLGSAALVVSVAGIPRNVAWTALLLAAGAGLVALFLVGRSSDGGGRVASHGLSAGPAQVDLSHPRHADGRHHGRHVRAAVRTAARPSGARRRRLSRGGARHRVDDQRDRERIGDQTAGDRADRRRRTAGDGDGLALAAVSQSRMRRAG